MSAVSQPSPGRLPSPEPVNPWVAWSRKLKALGTVTRHRRTIPHPEELSEEVRSLCERSAAKRSLPSRIWTLWRVESLTFAVADRHFDDIRLRDLEIPPEAGPPAHCGLAMAAVLGAGFAPERLTEYLEEKADPKFIDFAFETLGLMLAAYETDFFGRVTDLLGRSGLMRRYRIQAPEPDLFLRGLPEIWQPYAAHGYGRLLYFKTHRLRDLVRVLETRPYMDLAAAVTGAMSAYVLVNSADLERILSLVDERPDGELGDAVAGGLRNVLQLLEWSVPGCFATVEPAGQEARDLLSAATAEAAARRRRGDGPGLVV